MYSNKIPPDQIYCHHWFYPYVVKYKLLYKTTMLELCFYSSLEYCKRNVTGLPISDVASLGFPLLFRSAPTPHMLSKCSNKRFYFPKLGRGAKFAMDMFCSVVSMETSSAENSLLNGPALLPAESILARRMSKSLYSSPSRRRRYVTGSQITGLLAPNGLYNP